MRGMGEPEASVARGKGSWRGRQCRVQQSLDFSFYSKSSGQPRRVKSSNFKSSEDDAGCLVEMD